VNRAELGALRDAIDTILSWPDPVRDQIARWLQTDASKPNHADRGTPRSRSNRQRGFMPSVESAAREQALLEAMRDQPEAGVVQWAKATHCHKSAVSMRLGRLAKRGVVERDGEGRWRVVEAPRCRRRLEKCGGGCGSRTDRAGAADRYIRALDQTDLILWLAQDGGRWDHHRALRLIRIGSSAGQTIKQGQVRPTPPRGPSPDTSQASEAEGSGSCRGR
jgi:hypothetical protein